MAAVLVSILFSPFFYGLEFFLASTLTTQVALSVATIVVSTATIFYCQRAFYQWYEDTAEFIVRIKNKVGLTERHVTFTAKGQKEDGEEGTEEEESLLGGDTEEKPITGGNIFKIGEEQNILTIDKTPTKDKPAMPLDSWLQKQTVAMHRSHWVAKPGRIAPTTFIGIGRRGSADNTPTLTSGKAPPWITNSEGLSEQRTKQTLDRRQSSPSSLGSHPAKVIQTTWGSELRENTSSIEEIDSCPTTSLSDLDIISGTALLSEVTEESRQTSTSATEEVSRGRINISISNSDDVAIVQDETPKERLVPTETEVKEALLVDSLSSTPSLQANIQPLPTDSSESDRPSHSQTSEERSSGQTDTDSLATDDIFSDSELDDSKRSDDVFIHDDVNTDPGRKLPVDIFVDDRCATMQVSFEGVQPEIVVCEADTTIPICSEITEAEPDSSISLSVEGGPMPRKDSFGLLPVLKGRVHHVKIETTSYAGPITAIHIEETKSESDSEISGIMSSNVNEEETNDERKEYSRRPRPPAPQKQDSLGVPPIVTGEVSFPGVHINPVETDTASSTKVNSFKLTKVDSLEVPPIIKLEDRLPPYPIKNTVQSNENNDKPRLFQEVRVRLPHKNSLPRQGRPTSLDIPSLNISESCPPRRDSSDRRIFPKSSLKSFRSAPNYNKSRKQGPSILKRSGSVDRNGPKKSVTFSPIVIPWGDSSEEGIEPSGGGSDLKRHTSPSMSPIRPKVIRYNSVDVPDTMRRRQRTEFIRQLGMPAEASDEDQESWEQGRFARFYRKSNQRDDRKGTKFDRKRMGIDEGPIKTDSIQVPTFTSEISGALKKSAKQRFLEAGGAKAVMSVLVTQYSSDRGTTPSPSSSEGKESPLELNKNDEAGTSWARSRFLLSSDGNMRASLLFVERVRGSLDLSESVIDHSPSDTNEDTSSSSDQQFEETEEGGIRCTSAKSRFLWSCREHMPGSVRPTGSIPVDRLFALWEPAPVALLKVQDGDGRAPVLQITEMDRENESSLDVPTSDRGDVTKYDIDSPESSGLHDSMELDEGVSDRLLQSPSREYQNNQTKHVPSSSMSATLGGGRIQQLKTAIVMDNGSQYMKVGLIDEKKPSIELPNIISRDIVESFNSRFIGLEAVKNCTVSPFEYPMIGGLIQNWDDVESIWNHIFDAKLGLSPQEHPLLMTEIATVPKLQRERILEILFETFSIPSLYFANQAALSLRATGSTTGLALSSGSGVTEVVPVYNGVTLSRAVTKLDLGGRSATKYLAHLIEKETGRRLVTSPGAMEVLRELKEDQTFVNNVSDIVKSPTTGEYEDTPWHCWLPDGSTVEVNREHVQACAEPLFQPAMAGILHQPGMPNLVADCLDRCDQNVLSEFPLSLLLCGGNTYLGGFKERLQSELNTLGLGYITVDAPQGRDLLPWIGGALLASHLDSEGQWLSSDEYVEHGVSIVHKRCT